ncbi:TetR/AcrR family transcriptional regulator [Salinimicrobium sp. GXAS 041]|uniref:TetR/AcrR family transcriptional regulator n=1 Tax=Salinimicrobium sp. GXAS 041 TaxID=3400806 RepID=UPI003C74B107
MGIVERKERKKAEMRKAILEASWELVLRQGWQALSIRKIADAIEYSVPVIYDHFANKEAILLELTRRGFQNLNDRLLEARAKSETPEGQIEAMAAAYWKFAFENEAYYQVMYGLGIPSCETVNRIAELGVFTDLILEPIKKLINAGSKPQTDPFLKLHTFWSMLHGLVSINMMGTGEKKEEMNQRVLQDFICSFLLGFKG